MSQPVLNVKQLTKQYNGVPAVDRVSFSINAGEIVGLVGPNGAGKTTTCHMLLSLLEPTDGTIEIFGKDLLKNRQWVLEQMNFAAPYAALPYNLTPYENLRVFSLLYGIKEAKEKINNLLHEFNLEGFQKRRVGILSTGEQMRVALAKAFLNDPKFLILDEPTSSLDPAVSREIRQDIYRRKKKNNGAVLWTSHNMREIEEMCDRVIFLFRGRIIEAGRPDELRKKFGEDNLEEIFITLAQKDNADNANNKQ